MTGLAGGRDAWPQLVAATRARDHLVVSVFHPARNDKSHAALLWPLCQAAPNLWQPFEPVPVASGVADLGLCKLRA